MLLLLFPRRNDPHYTFFELFLLDLTGGHEHVLMGDIPHENLVVNVFCLVFVGLGLRVMGPEGRRTG